MPNICTFYTYLVGSKKDIVKFNSIMKVNDYNYYLSTSFAESLGLYKDSKSLNCLTLKNARELAEKLNNKDAITKLKNENLTKECFNNIPDENHFYRIFDYWESVSDDCSDGFERLRDDYYIFRGFGDCAHRVDVCIAEDGYYADRYEEFPEHLYKGTNIIDISKLLPNLKICFISEETSECVSEFICVQNGQYLKQEIGDLETCYYESIEEAKEDDMDITEDQLNKDIYLELPKWYEKVGDEVYINEDIIFEALDCMDDYINMEG